MPVPLHVEEPLAADLFADVPEGVTPANARARAIGAANAFRRHYHHAAPFSRTLLETLWQSCAEPGCGDLEAAATLALGDLAAESGRKSGGRSGRKFGGGSGRRENGGTAAERGVQDRR